MHFKILSLAILFGATAVIADGGFASTCDFCTIIGTSLQCDCADREGELQSTNINLNRCIVNNNGLLYCQAGGNFGGSCSGCSIDPGLTDMTCECKNREQIPAPAYLQLNDCIGNQNGVLAC